MSVWSVKKKEETKKPTTYTLIHTRLRRLFSLVRRDGAEARKERITMIARTIQAALHKKKDNGEPEELQLDKTVARLSIETGLTREKLMEYLFLLESDEQFTLDMDNNKIRRTTEDNQAI
jgi:hypothetical protein